MADLVNRLLFPTLYWTLSTRKQLRDYEASMAESTRDLYEVDDTAFKDLARQLAIRCGGMPSAMGQIEFEVVHASEQSGEELDKVVASMRQTYNEIKDIQSSMIEIITRLGQPSTPK